MKSVLPQELVVKSPFNSSLYEDILYKVSYAVVVIDTYYCIQFFNLHAQALTGFSLKDVVGLPIDKLLHPDLTVADSTLSSFTKQNANEVYCNIATKDGSTLQASVISSRIEHDDTIFFVLHFKDATNQHHVENELKAKNEQLAKLNMQMERILYSASHDLRSPVTSTLGLVNLMRMETHDEILLDYISKIETSTFKLDKIIRDLMVFSKMAYQRKKSEKLLLPKMVNDVVDKYRSDMACTSIFFDVRINDNAIFYSDAECVAVIIENIVRNAIQFYDKNKTKPLVRVTVTIDEEKALMEIIDNGIGIGREHLKSVFNMFYRASTASNGAGLGLYIVKESIEQLHGSITIDSEVGFGSIFKISLPNDAKGKLISRKLKLSKGA